MYRKSIHDMFNFNHFNGTEEEEKVKCHEAFERRLTGCIVNGASRKRRSNSHTNIRKWVKRKGQQCRKMNLPENTLQKSILTLFRTTINLSC